MTTPAVWKKVFETLDSDFLGINYDPSHFVWQMIDYIQPLYELHSKIFTVVMAFSVFVYSVVSCVTRILVFRTIYGMAFAVSSTASLALLERLTLYGNYELFVINTANTGMISMKALPLDFKYAGKDSGAYIQRRQLWKIF